MCPARAWMLFPVLMHMLPSKPSVTPRISVDGSFAAAVGLIVGTTLDSSSAMAAGAAEAPTSWRARLHDL